MQTTPLKFYIPVLLFKPNNTKDKIYLNEELEEKSKLEQVLEKISNHSVKIKKLSSTTSRKVKQDDDTDGNYTTTTSKTSKIRITKQR